MTNLSLRTREDAQHLFRPCSPDENTPPTFLRLKNYMTSIFNRRLPSGLGLTASLLSVLAIAFLQAINSFGCYDHDLLSYLKALTFIAVPMLPALVCVVARKPARAVAASIFFAPWLVFAFYTDCVRPGVGGGASLAYATVMLYGFPSALLGAVFGPTLWQLFRGDAR